MIVDGRHPPLAADDSSAESAPRTRSALSARRDAFRAKTSPGNHLALHITWANRAILALCLWPFLSLLPGLAMHSLGANPVETMTRSSGLWSLRLLWLTLCVTPLRTLTGWNWLTRLRRAPALCCFFYACLHALIYLTFEVEFAPGEIWVDVSKKPFILAGMVTFLVLIPLALTSTDAMMRRLGGRNWRKLHRLTYVAAVFAALHYLLLVKRDISEPAIYIQILCLLFWLRWVKTPTLRSHAKHSSRYSKKSF